MRKLWRRPNHKALAIAAAATAAAAAAAAAASTRRCKRKNQATPIVVADEQMQT